MTQLANRALLSAVLALAVLVLVLTAAALSRPDTAVADPPRAVGQTAHYAAKPGKAKAHARFVSRKRPQGRRRTSRSTSGSTSRSAPETHQGAETQPRRARRPDREPTDRHSLRLGRSLAAQRLRLLGARSIRVREARHPAAALHRLPVRARTPRVRSGLRPGDLVFFYGLNHVGIYAGGGKYIHAPRAGTTVRWSSLASSSFYGARRIVSA